MRCSLVVLLAGRSPGALRAKSDGKTVESQQNEAAAMSSEVESDRATSTAGGQVVGGEFRTLETTVTVFETEAESLSSTNLNFQEDRVSLARFQPNFQVTYSRLHVSVPCLSVPVSGATGSGLRSTFRYLGVPSRSSSGLSLAGGL